MNAIIHAVLLLVVALLVVVLVAAALFWQPAESVDVTAPLIWAEVLLLLLLAFLSRWRLP